MAVIDVFLYNGEREILKLHLAMLDKHVDTFLICEAKTTFSGNKKPLYLSKHMNHLKEWWHKIEYYIIDEDYSPEEVKQAHESPLTIGPAHWKTEWLQKESIKKALTKLNLKDDDTVYIGDVDEIWEPTETMPAKLKLRVYTYYLNNRSSEQFWGTFVAQWKDIKDACLNDLRNDQKNRTEEYKGHHFTSMGGLKEVQRKLNDSYSTESYNRFDVQYFLPANIINRRDFLGRPFTYELNEQDWPQYLKENKVNYSHLCLK
jgi:beta-1,4-mannosyl-glycoprotein beta-1,4-N-acetylglucosaminyltransferase